MLVKFYTKTKLLNNQKYHLVSRNLVRYHWPLEMLHYWLSVVVWSSSSTFRMMLLLPRSLLTNAATFFRKTAWKPFVILPGVLREVCCTGVVSRSSLTRYCNAGYLSPCAPSQHRLHFWGRLPRICPRYLNRTLFYTYARVIDRKVSGHLPVASKIMNSLFYRTHFFIFYIPISGRGGNITPIDLVVRPSWTTSSA